MQEKFRVFSDRFSGEIIAPLIGATDITSIESFKLNTFIYWQNSSVIRNIYSITCIVLIGLARSWRSGRFDVVISPNPLGTALAGWMLARLTGAKLIVEVNGNFESAFKFSREGLTDITLLDRLREKISRILIPFNLRRATVVKLVYRDQLVPLNINLDGISTVAFPDYVPIKRFLEADKADDKYVLLLGYPWYLKGVDILIKAFNQISSEFHDYRLKVVGWCPEGREYFEDLAKDNPNIELLNAVEYEEVIELMTHCSLYALASRTDSAPRVLFEAMASRKPIVAASVDGVPELIKDGYNGLLFTSEDYMDLANKIRMVLSDAGLADRIAGNGYNHVREHLSEKVYFDKYSAMILQICASEDQGDSKGGMADSTM